MWEHLNCHRFLLGCALTGGGIVATDVLSKSGQAQVSDPGIVTSDKMRVRKSRLGLLVATS